MAQATSTPTSPRPIPATVVASYAHLIERMKGNRPAPLGRYYRADADDLTQRAEHLDRLLLAVEGYIRTAISDLAQAIPDDLDQKYLWAGWSDFRGDLVGNLLSAAERAAEREAA